MCEDWCNLGDAGISGDTTLLKKFTVKINNAQDKLYPRLYQYLRSIGYDDPNQTGIPTKLTNIVSGTGTYTISTDTNSFEILELLDIAILTSSSGTEYTILEKIDASDERAPLYMSPNPSQSGVPSSVLIVGNKIFFDVVPNYNATNGIKSFAAREMDRFASSDTSQTAGIPLPFQSLLPVYASHEWLIVNKPDNSMLITRLEAEIQRRERDLENFMSARNSTAEKLTVKKIAYR